MSVSIPQEAHLKYQTVLKADPSIDWVIYSLSTADTSLRVQATGSGLDDLEEEFMDGRIQYAFARVEDPSSGLDKFVQINWCGEGVAERQKGLFNTWSPQISTFLHGAHLIIQARQEADVSPAHIHKRLQEGSGSKYGGSAAAAAPAPKQEPIARVGTSYQKTVVDMQALRSQGQQGGGGGAAPPPTAPRAPSFNKPTPAPTPAAKPTPAPTPAAPPAEIPAAALHPPAPPPQLMSASTPAPEPSKPAQDDRIAPVGTNYQPVVLPKPGKLGNRWGAGAQQQQQAEEESSAPPAGGVKSIGSRFGGAVGGGGAGFGGAPPAKVDTGAAPGSGKKMTWSERQAEAKRVRDEEERASKEAISKSSGAPTPPALSSGRSFMAPPPSMIPRLPSTGGDEEKEHEGEDDWDAPAAPPPPPPGGPSLPSRPGVAGVVAPPAQDEEDDAPPPPPPPPPMPSADPVGEITRLKQDLTLNDTSAAPPVPQGSRPGAGAASAGNKGLWAVAIYDYDAAEDNEIGFKEGEEITRIKQEDADWWEGTTPSGQTGLFPAAYVEVQEGAGAADEDDAPPAAPPPPPMPSAPVAAQDEEDDAPPPPPPPPPMPASDAPSPAGAVDEGKVAVAQYDYDAAEGNEISFKEGDRIVRIVETDPDWWTGTAPDGSEGLFPANYVEMQ